MIDIAVHAFPSYERGIVLPPNLSSASSMPSALLLIEHKRYSYVLTPLESIASLSLFQTAVPSGHCWVPTGCLLGTTVPTGHHSAYWALQCLLGIAMHYCIYILCHWKRKCWLQL